MKLYPIFLLACALALGGCVSASKLKSQQALTDAQQKRADSLDKDLAAAKKDLAAAQASLATANDTVKKDAEAETGLRAQLKANADQLASLNTQMESVQKSNKDLQESLDAKKGELSKKVSELIKEKDDLSQKLAVASNDLSSATARAAAAEAALAKAQDEKTALEKAKADELAQVKKSYEDLNAGLKSEIAAGEVTITQLKGKLTVNMVDRILFDPGQADIRSDGKKVLEKVGKILTTVADKDIRIEGHTDNKPISGDLKSKYATNWELSTARATTVLRYLQDNAKVDPKHLVAAGYGEFRPVAANDTPENRQLNRRIEIVLVPRD